MSNYNSLKATINANIKANGNQEITGPVLNSVLTAMVNALGGGYEYVGIATPTTSPGTPDNKIFYVATTPGTYTNFGGAVVNTGEVAVLRYDSSWHKDSTGIATAAQVNGNALYPVNIGTSGAPNSGYNHITNTEVSLLHGHQYEITIIFPSSITFTASDSFKLMTASSTSNVKTLVPVAGQSYSAGEHSFIINWAEENSVINYRIGFYDQANATPGTIVSIRDISAADAALLPAKVGDWDDIVVAPVQNWIGGSLDTNLNYGADARRNIGTMDLDGLAGHSFYYYCESGYELSIRFCSVPQFADPTDINLSSSDILLQIGWVSNSVVTIPAGTKSAVIIERRSNNANIDISEVSNVSFKIDGITIARELNILEARVDELDYPVTTDLPVFNFENGSLSPNLSFVYASNRLIGTIDLVGMEGQKFNFVAAAGYKFSLRFISHAQFISARDISITNAEIIYKPDGWLDSGSEVIPAGVKSIIIIVKKSTEADISVSEASNVSFGITYTDFDKRIDAIESRTIAKAPDGDISGEYSGDLISLGSTHHPYLRKLWKTFGLTLYAQSFAIHGNYIVFFYGDGTSTGSLWRISDMTKLANLSFDYGSFNKPHGNVMNFGNEFASGNTDLPLLYLSQWDGQGGCFVYDIHLNGTCNLVQTIMASNMDTNRFGSSLGDWVVDKASNSIYSVKYHTASSLPSNTNYDNICRFNLPKLSDGASVVLTNADILESFTIPFTPIAQDKKIWNGLLFMAAGNPSYTGTQKIFVVDLGRKAIISTLNLSSYGDEPEGLEVLDEGLILGYGTDLTNFYLFTT